MRKTGTGTFSGGPPLLLSDPLRQVPEGGQGQAAEDGPDELDLC